MLKFGVALRMHLWKNVDIEYGCPSRICTKPIPPRKSWCISGLLGPLQYSKCCETVHGGRYQVGNPAYFIPESPPSQPSSLPSPRDEISHDTIFLMHGDFHCLNASTREMTSIRIGDPEREVREDITGAFNSPTITM